MFAKITTAFSVTDEDGITWNYRVGEVIGGWQAGYAFDHGYAEVLNPSSPPNVFGR